MTCLRHPFIMMAQEAETQDQDVAPSRPNAAPDNPIHRLGNQWRNGRPKGTKNRLTREREQFIDMVIGEVDSAERAAFAASMRQQVMAGTAAPAVTLFLLQTWLGKPKETLEIQAAPVDFADLTDEQLAARAAALTEVLRGKEAAANTIDVTPERTDALTRADELPPPRLVKAPAVPPTD
jgi:hypothetical protein